MINIKKANIYYNFLLIKNDKTINKYTNLLNKKPYLVICNIFDRHPKTSSICSLDTIFNLGFKRKELDIKLLKSLDKSQEYAFIFGSLIGFKIFFKPKLIVSLINSIAKYLIKLIFAVLDLIYIVLYSIFYICNRKNNKLKYKLLNEKKIKSLYTISYWKSKKRNSISHYYPEREFRKDNLFLSTEFYEFKSIGNGLKKCEANISKCIDFISLKDLFNSIYLLIDSYIFDFFGAYKKTYGSHINNAIKISLLNRRFLYLLNFKCAKYIIKDPDIKSIYIWSENQNDSRLFSVGLDQFKPQKTNLKIISYLGCSSFSSNYHQQFIPKKYELELGVWGQKTFMLPDQNSLNEMRFLLDKKYKNNEFKYKKIRKEFIRFKFKTEELNKSIIKDREFTFISHGTDNEFIQVLRILFSSDSEIVRNLKNNPLYIRLHPSLSLPKIKNHISSLKKELGNNFCKIIFLNNNDESLIETMRKTTFCIFGDSSLINLALSLDLQVISARTSYIYKRPIQNIYLKKRNLFFL